ncbi:MAG: DEAD/DEAH box helicase family protein [Cyclobacteriaceae bacterium]
MLKAVKWSESLSYSTGSNRDPIEFYLQALSNSKSFDLLLGYFSSAAINVLSLGFATFISSGGKMRIIANNVLSQEDKLAIEAGTSGKVDPNLIDLSNVKALRSRLDDYSCHFFECVAYLISEKRIEIKIIRPKQGKGIAHYKNGVFSDGENVIGFSASCNFTAYGLLENLERLDVFLKWDNNRSSKFIQSIQTDFENKFSGSDPSVEYLDASDIEVAIRDEFGNKSEQELIITSHQLLYRKRNLLENNTLKGLFSLIESKLDIIARTPRFPYSSGPREYQQDAYQNWVKNDFRGVFAMATGTGKTITSLNCLLEEYKSNGHYHGLILVPTITLVDQWEKEAQKFNFQSIIKVSSKHNWEKDLATTLSNAKRITKSFVVITTYASFVKDRFHKYINEFPTDTLLIADEAHNVGSPSVLNKLASFPIQKRIGLSATPKRIYDIEGTSRMETFFNDEEPYTYSFSMERAINEGILCKYYYHPKIVSLTPEELAEYFEISKKISKFYHPGNDNIESNEIVQKLLLRRKRIVHKAENKLETTIAILKDRFAEFGNLKYTFIYVPEGQTVEILEDDEETEENIRIINQYTREIGKIDSTIYVNQFISGMADRDEVLDQFKKGNIQVIASMKCLDEGVDIPRAEYAIFCSSTGNPRQFIQRRGRILRTHDDKEIAIIHDLVVIPDLIQSDKTSDVYKVERKLVEKELERVMYFASLSINPFDTERVFSEVCEHYDLNIYTIHNNLKGT